MWGNHIFRNVQFRNIELVILQQAISIISQAFIWITVWRSTGNKSSSWELSVLSWLIPEMEKELEASSNLFSTFDRSGSYKVSFITSDSFLKFRQLNAISKKYINKRNKKCTHTHTHKKKVRGKIYISLFLEYKTTKNNNFYSNNNYSK